MPELPEVETIAQDLAACLVGEVVSTAEVRWPLILATPGPDEFAKAIRQQTVLDVGRRGKYLLIHLSDYYLVAHLRMTGQLLYHAASESPMREAHEDDRHIHLVLRFVSGSALYYRDIRKFGRFWLVVDPQEVVGHLGPEPFDPSLTEEAFARLLCGHRRHLKGLLLDQTFLAGLGNIYADEALWRAGLAPWRQADTLFEPEAARLLTAIREVLSEAIAARGTTLSDYRDAHNRPGENGPRLSVYGRAGAACARCGGTIQRMILAGRGTWYCPVCQGEAHYARPVSRRG